MPVAGAFEDDAVDSTWTENGDEFSTKLPAELRFGCSYRDGRLLLTGDYHQGFSTSATTNTTPTVAAGAEWMALDWLPLRAGVTVGGRIDYGTSLGFGLRPGAFVFDFGLLSRGFLLPSISKGYIVGLEFGMAM